MVNKTSSIEKEVDEMNKESTVSKKKEAGSINDFVSIAKKYDDKIIHIYPFILSELLPAHNDQNEINPECEPGIQKNVWIKFESESSCYETLLYFRSVPIFRKMKKLEDEPQKPEDRLEIIGKTLRKYFDDEGFSVVYHNVQKIQKKSCKDALEEDLTLLIFLADKYFLEV